MLAVCGQAGLRTGVDGYDEVISLGMKPASPRNRSETWPEGRMVSNVMDACGRLIRSHALGGTCRARTTKYLTGAGPALRPRGRRHGYEHPCVCAPSPRLSWPP